MSRHAARQTAAALRLNCWLSALVLLLLPSVIVGQAPEWSVEVWKAFRPAHPAHVGQMAFGSALVIPAGKPDSLEWLQIGVAVTPPTSGGGVRFGEIFLVGENSSPIAPLYVAYVAARGDTGLYTSIRPTQGARNLAREVDLGNLRYGTPQSVAWIREVFDRRFRPACTWHAAARITEGVERVGYACVADGRSRQPVLGLWDHTDDETVLEFPGAKTANILLLFTVPRGTDSLRLQFGSARPIALEIAPQ